MSIIFYTLLTLIISGSKNEFLNEEDCLNLKTYKEIIDDIMEFEYFVHDFANSNESFSPQEIAVILQESIDECVDENPDKKFLTSVEIMELFWFTKGSEENQFDYSTPKISVDEEKSLIKYMYKKYHYALVELCKKVSCSTKEQMIRELRYYKSITKDQADAILLFKENYNSYKTEL